MACLTEYWEALRADVSWFGGGPAIVAAVVVWRELMSGQVPDELLRGPTVPWIEAARLVSDGDPAAAADLMASIGARTIEADLRLHAARMAVQADPAEAARQLDRATEFWRSVGATALLVQVDEVRGLLRSAAS